MGLFGTMGRETKGAIRSINYDVRHSKRFRKLGVLAVATVAGGMMAAGVLVRTPVPELIGMGTDDSGSGVTDNWPGFGSDTQGQNAESPTSPTEPPGGTAPTADDTTTTRVPPDNDTDRSDGGAGTPGSTPGLTPVEETTGPASEESDTAEPEPSEEPTTTEPSSSETPSEQPTPTKSPSESPTPSKTPTGK